MSNLIVVDEKKLLLMNNHISKEAELVFSKLLNFIDLTYMIYVYEDFNNNEKFFYNSNLEWQSILISNHLINDCPIYKAAFDYLDRVKKGNIIVPWNSAPPKNRKEKYVCGLRNDFDIANGIGYSFKGFGVRESIAFAGRSSDKNFYKYFTENTRIIFLYITMMRNIFIETHSNRIVETRLIH